MLKYRLELARVIASLRYHPFPTVRDAFVKMAEEDPELHRLVAQLGTVDVMERVFLALRDSIFEANKDKSYYLNKLREHNAVSEELGDYLEQLVQESAGLGGNNNSPYMCLKPGDIMSWRPIPSHQPPAVVPSALGVKR